MKIVKDRVVCMDYTIRLANGQVVESSVGHEPLTYIHGRRQIVPGVEKSIEGLDAGSLLEVVVPPHDAYGDRDPAGVFVVPRVSFPIDEEIGPGMMFSASRPDGKSITFRVIEASNDLVLVDTNHPLAGETLHISIHIHHVRDASMSELHVGRADSDYAQEQHYLA